MKAECSIPTLLEKISMKTTREVKKPNKRSFKKTIYVAITIQGKTAALFFPCFKCIRG